LPAHNSLSFDIEVAIECFNVKGCTQHSLQDSKALMLGLASKLEADEVPKELKSWELLQ
jgi:hypothetical protein